MRHKTSFLLLLGFVFALLSLLINFGNGAALGDEDEELEQLLKEFTAHSQTYALQGQENDLIPLNAQSKFLKRDNCNCTKFYWCDVEGEKNGSSEEDSSEGADVSVINIRIEAPEGGCSHYLDICCEKMKEGNYASKDVKPSHKERTCGKRNEGGIGFRIVGGTDGESNFGEFPWMAAITEKRIPRYPDEKPRQGTLVCGASLIHPKAVLTAAHCLVNKSSSTLQVRFGEWDTQTDEELYPYQEVGVEQIIMHPEFQIARKLVNDIAILILNKEVELGPNIAPICLPPFNTNLDGVRCLATGWGKNEFGHEGLYQAILKRVDLPIVPRSECQRSLREVKLGRRFNLHESFICAGGEPEKDTCKGDGGSPLVCQMPHTDYYVQYGIVSWGIGCGGNVPAVYVNVPRFSPWIADTMEGLGLETKYFKP